MKHNIYTFQFVQAFIVLGIGLWGVHRYVQTDPIAALCVLILGIAASFIVTNFLSNIPSDNIISRILFKEW